ncbi:hypothetical protein GGR50DRAFT_651441 [Xylaria sp. CBS 124048]|nr:hypothetical protein GGR50DRAFT_651441 [Xylaria sp. CBS 124048]
MMESEMRKTESLAMRILTLYILIIEMRVIGRFRIFEPRLSFLLDSITRSGFHIVVSATSPAVVFSGLADINR